MSRMKGSAWYCNVVTRVFTLESTKWATVELHLHLCMGDLEMVVPAGMWYLQSLAVRAAVAASLKSYTKQKGPLLRKETCNACTISDGRDIEVATKISANLLSDNMAGCYDVGIVLRFS